jgi:ABC-type Fe3+-siderophore transport system permease subunit
MSAAINRCSITPSLLWGFCGLAAALIFGWIANARWPAAGVAAGDIEHIIFWQSVVPRAVVALLAGAILGVSGLLLQRVLRNPLAEPSTIGISAGAQLAMAAATIFAPAVMRYSVQLVAFAGGISAVIIILALTWRRGLEPVSVVLAGMMVALTATAASAALVLANGEYLFGLFIWGGGSLTQQSWGPATALLLTLALGYGAAWLLLRPLALLGLDDASARSLGVALHLSRFLAIGVAVWMATTVAAEVGVIGFIGLAAPALATLSGARTLAQRLIVTPLIGAILLWLTDGLVQLFATSAGERIPTGAATALLGGPLLIWLLPRLRMFEWPSITAGAGSSHRAARPILQLVLFGCAMLAILAAALFVGQGPQGWAIADLQTLSSLVDLRLPRLVVAAAAGAMLGAAGVIIQRVTSNPLAGPEILGVGMGAGAGLAAVLLIFGTSTSLALHLGGSVLGAMAVLVVILSLGARGGLGPERLLFAGIAVNALCSAVLTAMIALGNQQSQMLMAWLSGSTSLVTASDAVIALVGVALLALPVFSAGRWLEIFPLGGPTALALGLPWRRARFVLIGASALLTALAALFIGPLSFVGLIAPHLARQMGLARANQHLAGAMLIGATLMAVSDWLARMAAFPYQLPVGLFAALIGGPYLVYLLARGPQRHV